MSNLQYASMFRDFRQARLLIKEANLSLLCTSAGSRQFNPCLRPAAALPTFRIEL